MASPRPLWRCDRVFPSQLKAGRGMLEEVLAELDRHGWLEHDVFGVHLAMEESLVNAIRHGNRLDDRKHVRLKVELYDDRVRIEIADEGTGFDPGAVPDPRRTDRLESPGGRGLVLIRAFMNRVEFTDSGRRLSMEKLRTPPAATA